MKVLKSWGLAALLVLLVACGGGGGSPGSNSGSGSGSNSGGDSTGGGTGSSGSQLSMQLVITDASGHTVNEIAAGGIFWAKATLRDASGSLVAGRRVEFTLEGSGIATLDPDSALSDTRGEAQVSIAPASLVSKGAATLKAVATGPNGQSLSASYDFSVSAANLSLSPIRVGSSSLASGGNTSVEITALVGGVPSSNVPVNIVFTATCGRLNGQDATSGISVTTDGRGVAAANYLAVAPDGSLCRNAVTLTAKSVGASAQTQVINVADPVADAVTFIGANPPQIFVAGSGATEQAQVKFRVLSSTGVPLPGVDVRVSLETNPGGVGIASSGQTTPVQIKTDQNGEVAVSVFSGTIPGPVKLRAALLSNSSIFAETQDLTVASGPAAQSRFSLAVETFNIEGGDIDGASTRLTVRVADRTGNAVQDGTVVNFTSESGQVAYSCSTKQENKVASCSVDFVAQGDRPADGRVAVLAYLAGVKDYSDNNGNNRFDPGIDSLSNQGDAFRDDNENDQFDTGEFVIPRGGVGTCAGRGDAVPSRANTCDPQLNTTVRQQTILLMSSSRPSIVNLVATTATASISVGATTETVTVATGLSFELGSDGRPLLPMPAGTTLAVTATDRTPGDGLSCSVLRPVNNTPVPNVRPGNAPGNLRTVHDVLLSGCRRGDQVDLTVTSPSGVQTSSRLWPSP